jgi:hypothetical protein
MLLPTKVLSKLLESLYRAAADPDLWGEVLADIARHAKASSAASLCMMRSTIAMMS